MLLKTNTECLHCGEQRCRQCGRHFDSEVNLDKHVEYCYSDSIQIKASIKYNFSQWVED
jgi:predicted Zn-ribbon and HTH transcriptional regulator